MSNATARERDAALRRAIISVNPDYFSWPTEAQERYRVRMPEEDTFRIRRAVLKELLGIDAATEATMKEACKALDDTQSLVLNAALLPLYGIGEDSFVLNEYLGDQTILDFPTLHDYDHDDHCFQQKARQEEDPDYAAKPYRGSLFHSWARLMIDGAFHYATLTMAAGHVHTLVDETGDCRIDNLIPHDCVEGAHHGKRDGLGIRYDMRPDAGGREPQLDELQRRFRLYMTGRYEALLDEFDVSAQGAVYMIDRSTDTDPHRDFVFTDKTALQKIRFRHFMKDCRAIAGDGDALQPIVERERNAAIAYVEQAYEDICANFDPKVVTFRKKRRIIMALGALDALEGSDE